jgi:hypothetical protein
MLRPNTLFVLGAAVSEEVGLPLGWKLKQVVNGVLHDRNMPDTVRYALADFGQSIWDGVQLLRDGLPLAASIDNLIEFHSANPAVVHAGKIGIAAAILDEERRSDLWINYGGPTKLRPMPLDNVFGDLMKWIVQRASLDTMAEAFSRVSFINFNYDRCLPQFVFRAITEHYGMATSEAQQIAEQIIVRHPYGSLGPLWGPGSVKFGTDPSPEVICAIADRLRTFSEGVESENGQAIKEMVAGAERIIFLGCAHHPQNMALLNPATRICAKNAYGTVYAPPPADPKGNVSPPMAEFLQPAIDSFVQDLLLWKAPEEEVETGPLLRHACRVEAATSRQLVARYGSEWTDLT